MDKKGMSRGFRHVCSAYIQSGGMAYFVIGLALMTVYQVINAKILQWLSLALDNPTTSKYVDWVIISCIVVTVINAVMSFVTSMSIHKAHTEMNKRIANKVLDADYGLFVKKSCSYIITTTESMWKAVGVMSNIRSLIFNMVKIAVNVIMIGIIEPTILPPIIGVTVVVGVLSSYLFRWHGKIDAKMDRIRRSRNKWIDESVNGFGEVRSFGTQQYHKDTINGMNDSILSIITRRNMIGVSVNVLSEVTSGGLTVIILLYCINRILNGGMIVSTGLMLVMYMWRMQDPIINIAIIVDNLSDSMVPLPKIAELLDYENEIKDGCIELESFDSSIKFNNLSFSYDRSSTVLKDVSFEVKKGEKIGICGPTGGGKSTLLKLIPRFYDVCEGSIEIDGLDIRDLDLKSFRRYIGIVQQDPYIFQNTIYENIVYGNWECTENDVIEACKKASIYDFIQSLPEKFQTDVGPKGLKLSGGQKQRIALARIFLNNPDIILLDEATSALDNETEAIIQESLEAFKDKTMIVIAHRLTTIKDSDKIIVINNHKIEEQGTHNELMETGGFYKRMWDV